MKKIFSVLVVLMAFVMLVTACGGKDVKVTDNTSDDSDDSGLKGELVYWSMWNQTEPQAMVLQEAIDDFMDKNKGVKVEINWNGREIRKTLQPALDNGQVIDIWDEDVERVVKGWKAYALQLDDYLEQTYPTTDGKKYKEVVMKTLLDVTKEVAEDGHTYAVPYQPFLFTIMYNKDHFKQAGIESVPKTWDEFMDACGKLKDAGFEPMTTDDAYVDTLIGTHLARLKGSEWVEELVNDGTSAMWDDPAVLQMAKDYEEMASKGYLSKTVGANKWPAGQQDIAAGTVSMYLNGTWLVNEIMGTTGEDFPWGAFSYPEVDGGIDDGLVDHFGTQAFQINKDTKNPDAAFALLVHLTTGEWDKQLAEKTYGVPVGGTTEWPVQLADAKDIFENLNGRYPWGAGIQANPDKVPVIVEAFTKLISGNFTAEEFVEAVKK